MTKDRNTILVKLSIVIKISHSRLNIFLEASFIFLININHSNAGSSFLMHQFSESGLSFDEEEGDALSSAELRKPEDKFNGIDVMGNAD